MDWIPAFAGTTGWRDFARYFTNDLEMESVGAGALGAVFLVYLYPLRLTPPRLIATDIVHAIPLAMFAGAGHLLMGNMNFD